MYQALFFFPFRAKEAKKIITPDLRLCPYMYSALACLYVGMFNRVTKNFLEELWRAKRVCGAPWVSKSTHPRKFGNHVTVHRPPARPLPVRPHHRATNVQSHTFYLVWEHWKIDIAHILHINVVIN